MKKIILIIGTTIMGILVNSCNIIDDSLDVNCIESQLLETRSVGTKTPKLTVYIETNDVNPLNAKEYYFTGTSPEEQVIDHVILFASNIRGTLSTVELYHNSNQTYILNNVSTLIAPLQNLGIKVLLGLLGDHTGVGFANLTSTQLESFAQAIASCVNTYGLDGVDFDDEYAEYGTLSGTPTPSSTTYGNLIQRVRELLPNKLITAFYYGDYKYFNQATMNSLDYMWGDFGCNSTSPTYLPNSKWAKLSYHFTSGYPSQFDIEDCVASYTGYGAIMGFNLRSYDCSDIMNYSSSYVWSGRTVSWTGTSHAKNY